MTTTDSPLRPITDHEALLLKRLNNTIKRWIDLPRSGHTYATLMRQAKLSHPTLMRLRKWKTQKDSPHLETIVTLLAAMGKRLKIVDADL